MDWNMVGAIGEIVGALSVDVWQSLSGAYARDFAEVVERRFGVRGHLEESA